MTTNPQAPTPRLIEVRALLSRQSVNTPAALDAFINMLYCGSMDISDDLDLTKRYAYYLDGYLVNVNAVQQLRAILHPQLLIRASECLKEKAWKLKELGVHQSHTDCYEWHDALRLKRAADILESVRGEVKL